jgi:hypothetical protein
LKGELWFDVSIQEIEVVEVRVATEMVAVTMEEAAVTGQVHFPVGVAGLEAAGQLGLLALGEALDVVAQQPTNLVERVVLVTSVAEGVLLDAAADLIDDLGPEADDMKGVEHRDRVAELVADRVRRATERIQGGLFDAGVNPLGWFCSQLL